MQRNLRPDLNEALFMERSGIKKREWKADKVAQIKENNLLVFLRRNQENIHQTFW
jgi:hypothetical protein